MGNVLLRTVSIVALAICSTDVAMAQTVPNSSPLKADGTEAQMAGLEEIIVTANRREESLQRAAVAVNVASGADMITAGVTEPYRLSQLAPGLTIQPSAAGNLIFLRGVGNLTTTPNSDPAIAFNYDGVYVGRPTSTNGLFFDLDRVEVLKGPQGTLYGRNATGGAINVIPTQPRLGEFSGYLTGTYGNYNAGTIEGAINAPMGDDGALRVSGALQRHDGYLADGTNDQKTESLRVQMKGKLTPTLTVRIAGDYSHLGGTGYSNSYLGAYSQTANTFSFQPSNLPISTGMFTPGAQAYRTSLIAGAAKRPYDPASPYPAHRDNFYGFNAQIDWQTGLGTLTIIPAFRSADLDARAFPGFLYRTREKSEQFSVEARLTGNRVGIFDYVLGGLYYDELIRSKQAISAQFITVFDGPNEYKTRSFAPFARLTAHLTDQLRLVGGLRYTRDVKTYLGTNSAFQVICVAAGCPTIPLLPNADSFNDYTFPIPSSGGIIPYAPGAVLGRSVTRHDDSRLVNSRVTYHGGIEIDVAPRSLLYATVETGYRAGGFNPATGYETYKPEYITAYTVGAKNRFFDNRLQLNIEGYWWNYSNQQVSHVGVDLSSPPRAANFLQNVGKSRIRGFEVEARAMVTSRTMVTANAQYLDTKYQSFSYSQLNTGVAPLNGCANSVSGTLVVVDCSGKPALNSPRWTINLGAQQTIGLGEYQLVAGVDSQYQSSRYVGFEYLPQQLQDASWATNAQLTLSPTSDRWSISAFVRNIENNRPLLNTMIVPATSILAGGTGAPRLYGLRLSARF